MNKRGTVLNGVPFSHPGLSFAIRKQGYELTVARTSDNFEQPKAGTELNSNDIRIRLLEQEVTKNGVPVNLTASEYNLLCMFMENADIVLSPEKILGRLWDCDEKYIDNNTLTVYIRRLRPAGRSFQGDRAEESGDFGRIVRNS